MRTENARLERVLERNPDAVLVEHLQGRHTVVRRDQVLADPADGDPLDDDLARWTQHREDSGGLMRYHLRPESRVDIGELVTELRGRRGGLRSVSPNHLLRAEPAWWFGPDGVPTPAPALAAPAATDVADPATVAVLDTGLCPHPWFEDRDWYAAQRGDDIAEVLDADLDHELDTVAGHGTFIAGVVLQQAPAARLLIRRLLGNDGLCDEFDLVHALRELLALRDRRGPHPRPIDVVNLSLGCYTFDDGPTPVIQRAVAEFGPETVLVACAGNDGSDRPFWPAALDDVLAVGALGADGHHRAEFSNHGEWVDACAVGERVHSTFVTFDGPRPAPGGDDPDRFSGYARWSGTSFAAPAVAGVIAARSGEWGVPAAEVARTLLDPATAHTMPDLGAVVSE